jgi:hypothetical protein
MQVRAAASPGRWTALACCLCALNPVPSKILAGVFHRTVAHGRANNEKKEHNHLILENMSPLVPQIPILSDVTKAVSARYGVLKRDAGIALRGLYIINPEVSDISRMF